MKYLMIVLPLISATVLNADDLIELRSAHPGEYRYADWAHTFGNNVVSDVYYIGVPGNNEFVACVGYALPSFRGLTVAPFICGSAIKEGVAAGTKEAVVASFERGKWKTDAFYANFQPIKGNTKRYCVLDAANLVYALSKKWEIGVSTGFFLQEEKWNPQTGPVVRRNDKFGSWYVSYRRGSVTELRFGRIFTIKKQ